jgi:ATP-binding cassette subfamily B protein
MTTPSHHHEEDFATTGRANREVWRHLLGYVKPYWKQLATILAMAVCMVSTHMLQPLLAEGVIDNIRYGDGEGWGIYIVIYFAMTVVVATCVMIFICACGKISTHMCHDIRIAGFKRLQELSFAYFDHRPVGWLMTRLTSDCNRLSRIFSFGMMNLLWGIWFLVMVTTIMLIKEWSLALLVLSVVPILVFISVFFQRRLLRASRAVRKTNSQITAAVNESINGVRTTKTLVREEENYEEFQGITEEMYTHSVRSLLLSATYFPVVMIIASIGTATALWMGGNRVADTANLPDPFTIGMLIAFIMYARKFFLPIQDLARFMADWQFAQAAAERVVSVLTAEPDIFDSPEVKQRLLDHAASKNATNPLLAEDGHPTHIDTIEFRDVDFAYNEENPVLMGLNLSVKRGQRIALVGPTGGGKTTIVSLLCRFYQPTGGDILFNGIDYRQRGLHWLQSQLGIVLQAPHLFSGSIRENIRYGRLDATDAEVEQAARLVCAHEFIIEAGGYDKDLGESGVGLSTGQKQLISFARAILANPQVFVMDEATSSIDTTTEEAIQKGIEEILKGRISFVIAHRLSTIRSADIILVVRDGQVVEQGTHQELLALRGEYFELYTQQFTQEHEAELLEEG